VDSKGRELFGIINVQLKRTMSYDDKGRVILKYGENQRKEKIN
jgi:hypothetical protein